MSKEHAHPTVRLYLGIFAALVIGTCLTTGELRGLLASAE